VTNLPGRAQGPARALLVLAFALLVAPLASPQSPRLRSVSNERSDGEARQSGGAATAAANSSLPELTEPVNDFAKVIDAGSAAEIDRMIRTLQTATGDIVIVATVPTIEPYGDISEYAVKLFANHGKGIGQKGKNNGLLIVVALKERSVKVEVG
jgi:hypothetical protein